LYFSVAEKRSGNDVGGILKKTKQDGDGLMKLSVKDIKGRCKEQGLKIKDQKLKHCECG
jgi:hypothetical protein